MTSILNIQGLVPGAYSLYNMVAREVGNTEDRFAVAVTKDDMVVGHVPREFSKLCWHFLRHGGKIACEVTGRRKHSSIEGKRLVVPCLYQLQN